MEPYTPQEEVRRTIISDMVKKRNSIVPLVLLWILKWIRGAFLDEPSSQAEREEGSKVIRRYAVNDRYGLNSKT